MYYPHTGLTLNHHGGFVDSCEKDLSLMEFKSLFRELTNETKRIHAQKILLCSERFTELMIYNKTIFDEVIKHINNKYNLIILYVDRNIQSLTRSGFNHFINIVNRRNILTLSNQFSINLNVKNKYFDHCDVKHKIYIWISKVYSLINSLHYSKIKVEYTNEIISETLEHLLGKNNIKLKCKNFYGIYKLNTRNEEGVAFYNYLKFCKINYLSSNARKFISYEQFLS